MIPIARFRCMCGNTHSLATKRVLEGIGVVHWRCTDCRRRFVIAFQSPDEFFPVYLDPGVRSNQLQETGIANPVSSQKSPMPPPAIEFACRCGERITAHSWMYGDTSVCPKCHTTLYLALKYHLKQKQFVIQPGYPHTATA